MSELAQQQQALLDAVLGPWNEQLLAGAVTQSDAMRQRGLRAYRSNGQALAQRALSAAYPVVAQLMGDDSFAGLARAFWHACPPLRGDMAQWGGELAAFIAADAQLQDEPYLPDVARLEWLLHVAATAADVTPRPDTLRLLLSVDPDRLGLCLAPAAACLSSAWPVASLVLAHVSDGISLQQAGALLQQRVGESVLVWRQGYRPCLKPLTAPEAALMKSLIGGGSLGLALRQAGDALDLTRWLQEAVTAGWLLGAFEITTGESHE